MAERAGYDFYPNTPYPVAPGQLACGVAYDFSVRVFRVVTNCRNPNYHDLYTRAGKVVAARLAHLTCPPAPCNRRFTLRLAREWKCGYVGNELQAWLRVKYQVYCALRKDENKPELPEPGENDFAREHEAHIGQYADWDAVNESIDVPADITSPIPCPGAKQIRLHYTEQVESCDGVNLHDAEDRAKRRAHLLSELMICTPRCTPTAQLLGVGSGCTGETINVDLTIDVTCA